MNDEYEKLKNALESKGIKVTDCDSCGISMEISDVSFYVSSNSGYEGSSCLSLSYYGTSSLDNKQDRRDVAVA